MLLPHTGSFPFGEGRLAEGISLYGSEPSAQIATKGELDSLSPPQLGSK